VWSADIPEGTSRKNESNDDKNYCRYIRKAVIHPHAKVMKGKHLGFQQSFCLCAEDVESSIVENKDRGKRSG